MPVYRYNGEIYDIPDEKVSAFEKQYPDATVSFSSDGDIFDIYNNLAIKNVNQNCIFVYRRNI